MGKAYLTAGRIVGFLGVAVCIAAAAVRFTGHFIAGGISAEALFGGGTAAIVTGCFLLLLAGAERS
jgi:hypothetical protein